MSELDSPDWIAIVPGCEGNGNTHTDQECQQHGWALIDTSEDDGPFLESSYREVLEDVVRLARAVARVRALTGRTFSGTPDPYGEYRKGYAHGVEDAKRALRSAP